MTITDKERIGEPRADARLKEGLKREIAATERRLRDIQRGNRKDAIGYMMDASIAAATLDTLRAVLRATEAE